MIRKLIVILLTGVMCLVGVTSALAVTYNEAPMLRVKVAAGELPPVEERLPEEPRVIEPLDEVGEYGGTVKLVDGSPWGWVRGNFNNERLFKLDPEDLQTIIPNVVKGYEFSKDYKSCKIFFRKGMKWSDGYPFTADDFVFFYEDVLTNKDLTPTMPTWAKPGGETLKVTKIDDYTVLYTFAAPYPTFIYLLTRTQGRGVSFGGFLPAHYVKQFHIKYNPKANELAKEKGFENWYQLFPNAANTWHATLTLTRPTIEPWILRKAGTEYGILERNPYYWKVDTAGNQLPYIDQMYVIGIPNRELQVMKMVSGEVDFSLMNVKLQDYPLLKEGEEEGKYKVFLWKQTCGSANIIQLNHTYGDLVLRKIIQDVRFKRALSLAIDRDEVNEVVYLGLGVPRQATVLPQSRYFEPEFAKAYAQYDPGQANRLLDEMGLTKRDKDGFRLRPDGKTLLLIPQFLEGGETPVVPVWELVKEYWEEVGIKVLLKLCGAELHPQQLANKVQVASTILNRATDILFTLEPQWFVPFSSQSAFAPKWYDWYNTNGKSGEEPPVEIKRLYRDFETILTTISEEERTEAGKDILRSEAENLWIIGIVGMAPQPCVISNRLRNVPQEGYSGFDTFWQNAYEPAQFFIKK